MPENTVQASSAETNMTPSESKTNAILAWIFAPITSFVWKDSSDQFLRSHARESFMFGVATIVGFLVLSVLNFAYSLTLGNLFYSSFALFGIGSLLSCLWSLVWLAFWAFTVVPRIMGAIKASNNQTWTVPYVSKFMSKYMKM